MDHDVSATCGRYAIVAAMRLIIFGCGGFGREVLEPAKGYIAKLSEKSSGEILFSEIAFAADGASGTVFGTPIISPDDIRDDDRVVVAVGDPSARRTVVERLSGFQFGEIIAPDAIIGPDSQIGEGAIFCPHSIVTASARIGRHFHCNIYSYVAHDCVLGDYVTFAPRVACNGRVHIEDGAYIGTGAILREGTPDKPLVIGRGAVVGAGAVVVKDVAPNTTVVGMPARPL